MKKILLFIIMTTVVFSCFAQKPKKTVKYRRADTGRYTTKEYNSKNPKTTIKETRKKINESNRYLYGLFFDEKLALRYLS